jgi:hypothetical protein
LLEISGILAHSLRSERGKAPTLPKKMNTVSHVPASGGWGDGTSVSNLRFTCQTPLRRRIWLTR